MSGETSAEFLKQVLRIVEWLNENNIDRSTMPTFDSKNNPIFFGLQKELDFALNKIMERESELRKVQLENCELLETVENKEKEMNRLRVELEREKWERYQAEMNLAKTARTMAILHSRIEELVLSTVWNHNGKKDEDVVIIGEERNYEKLWRKLGIVRNAIEDKCKRWQKYGEETRRQLERTKQLIEGINETLGNLKRKNAPHHTTCAYVQNSYKRERHDIKVETFPQISPHIPTHVSKDNPSTEQDISDRDHISLIPSTANMSPVSQPPDDEENNASTLTLTFHRSTTPSPSSEYPSHQVDFFHTLLGLPKETHYSAATSPVSPPLPSTPQKPQLPLSPCIPSSVIKFAGRLPKQTPDIHHFSSHSPTERLENLEIDLGHGIDPSKRHVGFFCLCGLQCSTKKTLQYHLQYFSSNGDSNDSISPTPTSTNTPYIYHGDKQCKRCGKYFSGGKEGLRRHILQEHHTHLNTTSQSPLSEGSPDQEHQLKCKECSEQFRTFVQLRLHLKVKHSSHLPRTTWTSEDDPVS